MATPKRIFWRGREVCAADAASAEALGGVLRLAVVRARLRTANVETSCAVAVLEVLDEKADKRIGGLTEGTKVEAKI